MTRSPARTFALLFAFALAVRVAYALAAGIDGPPVEDERGYVLLARSLAEGRGFELPLPGGSPELPPRTSFRAPLVPLLLAPVAAAGGAEAAFRAASILAGALAPPLLWLALRGTGLAPVAWAPAAALAVWPPSVHLSTRALSEPWAAALLLGALAVPARGGGALSGCLAGLAVLARPATLPAAALLALARGGARPAAVHLAVLALVLAPWAARNHELHGRALLTTNTGATLLGGNCAAALAAEHPGKWTEPAVAWDGDDPPDLGIFGWSALSEEESDRRFADRASDFLRDRPADAARLAAWKLVRLFDPDPRSAKDDAPAKRIVGWATLPPVVLLAAAGLVLGRGRDAGLRPFALLLAGTVATALVFYGDTRLRNPADPALLAFAAVPLEGLLRARAASAAAGRAEGRTES